MGFELSTLKEVGVPLDTAQAAWCHQGQQTAENVTYAHLLHERV